MPAAFVDSLPPFQARLSQRIVDRVISLREKGHVSFKKIGEELHLTPAKAKHIYERHYHEKALVLEKELEKLGRNNVWEEYCARLRASKGRYDVLKKQCLEASR